MHGEVDLTYAQQLYTYCCLFYSHTLYTCFFVWEFCAFCSSCSSVCGRLVSKDLYYHYLYDLYKLDMLLCYITCIYPDA